MLLILINFKTLKINNFKIKIRQFFKTLLIEMLLNLAQIKLKIIRIIKNYMPLIIKIMMISKSKEDIMF